MEIRRLDPDEWERHLPSSGFEIFHTRGALETLASHSEMDMQLFGGFKGEEAVGLLPVFIRENAVGRTAFSPPPSMGAPYLGPILMPASPKRRKVERVNRNFTEAVVDELNVTSRRTLFRMVCGPGYADPRPFSWDDQHVEPRFTYILDLSRDLEEVKQSFSSGLRREIRQAEDRGMTVAIEDGTTGRVIRDTVSRYEEQGEAAPVSEVYGRDLVERLGDRARTYVARDPQGEYQGGIVVLYSNDTAYYWQGGVSRNFDGVSSNSLLHWRIIEHIANDAWIESVDQYDLVGANTERLCAYKAKFGASLVPYYVVESAGRSMDLAKTAYRVLTD